MQATHRNGNGLSFYSMPEYELWRESLGGNASGWSIKYYKVCVRSSKYSFLWCELIVGNRVPHFS